MSKPNTDAADLCDEESESVRVYVRVRPFNRAEQEMSAEKKEILRSVVQMRGPNVAILDHANDYAEKDAMIFDDSFWSIPPEQQKNDRVEFATQELVFQKCGRPLVLNMFDGYNSCIFAYGQTGSGKTYSMMGYGEDTGLIPRLCHNLFDSIEADKIKNPIRRYDVVVMFFEIYNEKVKDLFHKKMGDEYLGLKVRNHPITGPYVEGLETKKVFTAADCLRLIDRGAANRTTKSTGMNDTSSRSHAIFKIEFTQTDDEIDDEGNPLPLVRISQMNLVDLAGSERIKKSKVSADKLIEATNINQSLTTLRKVIDALIDIGKGKKVVAPYRESMLTWVLSESLGGNSKTVMIAAVSPHYNNDEESHSTLRYALRAKSIVNKVRVNESKSAKMLREMKEQMANLQKMIADGDVGENAEIRAAMKIQIEAKQEEMRQLQSQEKDAQRATDELVQMMEDEKKHEKEMVEESVRLKDRTQEARVLAQEQKKSQFSSAFKNAFKLERKTKSYDRDSTELKRTASDLRRKVIAQEGLEAQALEEIEVYAQQQSRYEADLARVTGELVDKQADVNGLSKRIDMLETKIAGINKSTSEAVALASGRIGGLTEHYGELERHRQVTLVCSDRAASDLRSIATQHEELVASHTREGDARVHVLEAQKAALEQAIKRKSVIVAELMSQCGKHERTVASCTSKMESLHAQRAQVNDDYVGKKLIVGREIAEVKHSFSLDRTKCITRCGDGTQLLHDIRKIIESVVHKPSAGEIRAGRQGVAAWLAGLGLERHIGDFDRQGFTDLFSLSNVSDLDLQEMKIMGGARRKVLTAAGELATALREVTQSGGSSLSAAASPEPSSVQNSMMASKLYSLELLGEMERWLHDMRICMANVSERIQP